jgi:hypothetical protein
MRRRDVSYAVGDRVMLSHAAVDPVNEEKKEKLRPRFYGPFTIKRQVSAVAYELELPRTFTQCHPVFHVSMLKPFKDGSEAYPERVEPPPPKPVVRESGTYYVVEQILARDVHRGSPRFLAGLPGGGQHLGA